MITVIEIPSPSISSRVKGVRQYEGKRLKVLGSYDTSGQKLICYGLVTLFR